MATRSSQRSVVNTKYGDRPIIDLPGLGERRTAYFPEYTTDSLLRNYPNVPSASNFYYYSEPNSQFVQEPQVRQPTHVSKPNVLPEFNYVPVQNSNIQLPNTNVIVPQPFPYDTYRPQIPVIANAPIPVHVQPIQSPHPVEINHYYGPNGEKLPGPPLILQGENGKRHFHPTNFTLEGILEYGTLISVNVKRGNISFRDIPDFLLKDLMKTYKVFPRTKIIIIAEDNDYSIYSQPELYGRTNSIPIGYSSARTSERSENKREFSRYSKHSQDLSDKNLHSIENSKRNRHGSSLTDDRRQTRQNGSSLIDDRRQIRQNGSSLTKDRRQTRQNGDE